MAQEESAAASRAALARARQAAQNAENARLAQAQRDRALANSLLTPSLSFFSNYSQPRYYSYPRSYHTPFPSYHRNYPCHSNTRYRHLPYRNQSGIRIAFGF
ncbi:MAG: hypothetical protein HC904_15620 [Blastochloris sp.]|nr:hypothetical protein [Blastochloris sp.]